MSQTFEDCEVDKLIAEAKREGRRDMLEKVRRRYVDSNWHLFSTPKTGVLKWCQHAALIDFIDQRAKEVDYE